MYFFKKIKLWWKKVVAIFGIAVCLAVGADLTTVSQTELQTKIELKQAEYLKKNGKYFKVAKENTADFETLTDFDIAKTDFKTDIIEYQTPDGSKGYEIRIYENGELIKSVGYGKEATLRTIDYTATTTK